MKMKFGAIVVAGSGKIGGHVASKNRGGAYLRTKVTPTNPQTASQSAVRNTLGSLATGWSELTEAQRLSFNEAVKDFATTDIFGDIKNPSGINLYVKLNTNLINAGLSQITSAPAKVEVFAIAIEEVVFNATVPGSSVIVLTNTAADTQKVIVSATPKVTPGTSYVKNLFRNINAVAIDNADITFGDEYVAKFGNLVDGDKFFVKVEIVMPNGQKGTAVTSVVYAQEA
jgi:hypothetical protein